MLFLGSFALGLDAYILVGLLPDIAQSLKSSVHLVSLGIAIFTASYAISAPILSGLFTNIKYGLLFGLGLFFIGNIITISAHHLTLFYVARCLAGMGAGIFSPLCVNAGKLLFDENYKGRVLALILGGLSVGTAFGVPISLLLLQDRGWHVPFYFILICTSISTIGVLKTSFVSPPSISIKNKLKNLTFRPLQKILFTSFLTAFSSLGLYSFLGILIPQHLVLGMWCWGIGGLCGAFSAGWLLDHLLTPQSFLKILLCTLLLGLSLLFIFPPVGCLLWGFAGWASIVPQQYKILALENIDTTAAVALNSSINYLGGAVGTALGSILLTLFAPSILVMVAILILLFNLFIVTKK